MNIFITGGAGFIGTNTALYFGKNKKNKITVLDNLSRKGTEKNIAFLKQNCIASLSFIQGNVQDSRSYTTAIKKADVIIHLAGQTAVTTSIADPANDFLSNIQGGFTLLETVRKYNTDAVVLYSSTNKVYGNLSTHTVVKNEKLKIYTDVDCPLGIDESEPLEFISPYGCSKGTIDQYMLDYHRSYGLKTVVFRQSCIYGPHQLGIEDQGWVAHFSKQVLNHRPITLFGDGYQVRDLLYVADLVKAYESAVEKIKNIGGQVFNVGGGKKNSFSLLQVLDILKEKTEISPQLTYNEERLGDQKYFVSNNEKAKKLLNWTPTTSFTNGVTNLISWQQKNR